MVGICTNTVPSRSKIHSDVHRSERVEDKYSKIYQHMRGHKIMMKVFLNKN